MTRAEATLAGLRKVAEMPCVQARHNRYMKVADCREREAVVMGGKIPPEEQRRGWCPRCVAADALEHMPE